MTIRSSISNKEIFNIAYPIIFGNLAQTLITFTDTAFLGHVGQVELGASMLAGIYYYVFSTLAWGFAVGVQIIVARRFGEHNFSQIGKVFDHALLVVLFISCFLFLILHLFTSSLLNSFISSPNVYAAAMQYMNYRHFGIIFVCFNFLFRSLYIGLSQTKIITMTTLLMAVINIFFDYVLIFGNLGFPKMGISGAAVASIMAEISSLCFFTFYTLCKLPIKKYMLFSFSKIDKFLMKSIVKLSFPSMLQRLISFGSWFVFFVMIEKMGEGPIAVTGIARSVYMLILIPVFAFGATANTLTSRQIGEGKKEEVTHTLRRICKISYFCLIPLVLLCIIIPNLLTSIYTSDHSLSMASVPVLYMCSFSALAMAVAMVLFEAVSGTGNTIAALFIEMGVLLLYIGYILLSTSVFHFQIQWVWGAESVYAIGLSIISFIYLRKAHWYKKRI